MRSIVEELTIGTYELLAHREPGAYVDLEDHLGGRATEADLAARDWMANQAKLLRPQAIFVSEDSNRPAEIPYPDPSEPAEVFLADPLDGSRQFGQLGFGYATCVSYHTYWPGEWWQPAAAAITASSKTASWDARDGLLVGVGGNTDDSIDLRQYTTRARVRIPPCIAVGASSASGIPLLPDLMWVRDPEVALDATAEEPYLRVWNTAGNPITPGLLRSHTMVAVQLQWSTQWDTLFAFFASASGMNVYPLTRGPWGTQQPIDDDGPVSVDWHERRLLWGRPRWAPFERKCIPPIVVGPDEPFTREVYEIVRSSECAQIERPAESGEEQSLFDAAMQRDNEDLLAAVHNRLVPWE